MKIKSSLALFSLFVFLAGCTSLQTGGEATVWTAGFA